MINATQAISEAFSGSPLSFARDGYSLLFITHKEDIFVMLVSHGLLCSIQTALQEKASWPPVQIEINKYQMFLLLKTKGITGR